LSDDRVMYSLGWEDKRIGFSTKVFLIASHVSLMLEKFGKSEINSLTSLCVKIGARDDDTL